MHKLRGAEHLLKQRAKLHLAPCAARFYICKHPLEVAYIRGQRRHLAQPLGYIFKLVVYHGEAFAEALVKRAGELFIHRFPYELQLFLVARRHIAYAVFHAALYGKQLFIHRAADVFKGGTDFLKLGFLVLPELTQRIRQLLSAKRQRPGKLLAGLIRA